MGMGWKNRFLAKFKLQTAGQGSFGPNEPIYFFGENGVLQRLYNAERDWTISLYIKGSQQTSQDDPASSVERFHLDCIGKAL